MIDRRDHYKLIREHLDDYDLILIDRFDLSTEAYQGYGDGVVQS
jgi:thymidylate kinase